MSPKEAKRRRWRPRVLKIPEHVHSALCDSAWSPGCLCAFWDPPPFMGGPCTPALLSVQCWEGEVPQGMKGPSSPCESGKWHWYVGMPQRAALSR